MAWARSTESLLFTRHSRFGEHNRESYGSTCSVAEQVSSPCPVNSEILIHSQWMPKTLQSTQRSLWIYFEQQQNKNYTFLKFLISFLYLFLFHLSSLGLRQRAPRTAQNIQVQRICSIRLPFIMVLCPFIHALYLCFSLLVWKNFKTSIDSNMTRPFTALSQIEPVSTRVREWLIGNSISVLMCLITPKKLCVVFWVCLWSMKSSSCPISVQRILLHSACWWCL